MRRATNARKDYSKLQENYDKLQSKYDNVIVRVDILEKLLGIYKNGLEALDRELQKGLKEKLKKMVEYAPSHKNGKNYGKRCQIKKERAQGGSHPYHLF